MRPNLNAYMKNSYIDIVIPIYKVEAYLHQCVDSVINQTYKSINIILVDDGSPDSCPQICDVYASKYKNISVIHKSNGGLSDARNAGFRACTSEFIMFLDSDDWLEPNAIEKMMELFVEYDADIVCTHSMLEFEKKTICHDSTKDVETYNQRDAIKQVLNRKINVSAWGKIYKRSLFKGIEYPKGKLHEDIPVIFQILLKTGKVVVTKEAFHHYRQQNGSISRSSFKEANHDLYLFVKDARFILKIYPDLKNDYEGFYYYSLKSLLVLFNSNKIKEEYHDYYKLYSRELLHNYISIIKNDSICLIDKISILLLMTPFYPFVKSMYYNITYWRN